MKKIGITSRWCLPVLASPLDLEVVISDNGSTDGSLIRVKHGSNLGFARGNNLALICAFASYVLILNPDCIVEPDSLERLLDIIDVTPGAGVTGCIIRINPDSLDRAGTFPATRSERVLGADQRSPA